MQTKFIIGAIIVIILAFGAFLLFNQKTPSENVINQDISEQELDTISQEKKTTEISEKNTPSQTSQTVTTERTPSRFACVGEYCDGSMSGDDWREKYTTITIPLIRDGGNVGCGAEIFFAPHAVPKTTAVLDATYKLLFDIKTLPEIQADGFRNTVGAYTKLFYDRVTLDKGIARVYLTGDMYGPGHCAEPELQTQMIQAALQYPTVNRVEIYLNGKIFDWCAMDQSDGEGPCPEIPRLWVGEK
jgi:hypothetical protein